MLTLLLNPWLRCCRKNRRQCATSFFSAAPLYLFCFFISLKLSLLAKKLLTLVAAAASHRSRCPLYGYLKTKLITLMPCL
ncbi:hypothetical protein PIB30_020957 [Stylosanthes scabra]|uniref:Uncharacterized protein n=1 Tax=Stylosanthes scabra TaxID=79078 RepID=A0ABU6R947_9FABA|nr:hypothetical protein [Stylosanthes scabra]